MRLMLVYNSYSEAERNTFARIKQELGCYIEKEFDMNTIIGTDMSGNYLRYSDVLPVVATPAFIPIRDDLCGEHLLQGDAQLNITAEVYKMLQEEEEKIHNQQTKRLDFLINNEFEARYGAEKQAYEQTIDLLLESTLGLGGDTE